MKVWLNHPSSWITEAHDLSHSWKRAIEAGSWPVNLGGSEGHTQHPIAPAQEFSCSRSNSRDVYGPPVTPRHEEQAENQRLLPNGTSPEVTGLGPLACSYRGCGSFPASCCFCGLRIRGTIKPELWANEPKVWTGASFNLNPEDRGNTEWLPVYQSVAMGHAIRITWTRKTQGPGLDR